MEQDSQKFQREGVTPSRIPPELAGKSIASLPPTQEDVPPEGPVQSRLAGLGGAGVPPASQFAEETHQYIREYIRLADQKAAFIFTAGAALLAFLYQKNVSQRWLKPPSVWSLGDFVAFLAMLGLACTTLIALAVVIPRLKGSRRGYIFWESIAEFESGTQYSAAVSKLDPADLALAKLEHCYELSKVCRQKYRILNLSIWIGAVGLISAVLYLLVF